MDQRSDFGTGCVGAGHQLAVGTLQQAGSHGPLHSGHSVLGDLSGIREVSQIVGSIRIQKLKSKNISAAGVEMTYEVRLDKPEAVLNKIHSIHGVQDATLVSYQGEAV